MLLRERLFVLLVVLCSVVLCKKEKDIKRHEKHLLALLGYLHGYKIGQDYALQLPPYLITPIVILPSVNQQQSVNIQTGSNDDNYQENGGTIQTIVPDKIISVFNASANNKEEIIATEQLNDDIEVHLNKRPDDKIKDGINNTATLRQSETSDNNTTGIANSTIIEPKPSINATFNGTTEKEPNATINGPYPSSSYNNQMINSLVLTTTAPSIENSQALPPESDNRWQNFTLRANLSNIISDNNVTMMNEVNITLSPQIQNVTEYPIENITNGPYPNAWYNNEAIDQLSITTNYYTNESPQPTNDRWGSYSPMNSITLPSGFRPLAGLYYDGFLHTPLRKYGFLPQYYRN